MMSPPEEYYGEQIGDTVDVYAAAFPTCIGELYSMYYEDDVVVVELSLNGTHKGDLGAARRHYSADNREIHAPCCDVFSPERRESRSFHCYVACLFCSTNSGLGNLSAAD